MIISVPTDGKTDSEGCVWRGPPTSPETEDAAPMADAGTTLVTIPLPWTPVSIRAPRPASLFRWLCEGEGMSFPSPCSTTFLVNTFIPLGVRNGKSLACQHRQ